MVDERDPQDDGIGTLIARAVADGRDYADAQIGYWKALAADRLADMRAAAIFGIVALLLVHAALIALVVGLVMTLTPWVGPGFATLIMVLVIAGSAALFGAAAWRRLRHAMRGQGEP